MGPQDRSVANRVQPRLSHGRSRGVEDKQSVRTAVKQSVWHIQPDELTVKGKRAADQSGRFPGGGRPQVVAPPYVPVRAHTHCVRCCRKHQTIEHRVSRVIAGSWLGGHVVRRNRPQAADTILRQVIQMRLSVDHLYPGVRNHPPQSTATARATHRRLSFTSLSRHSRCDVHATVDRCVLAVVGVCTLIGRAQSCQRPWHYVRVTDELPDPRRILEDTDWSRLEHANGSAFPETPAKLSGLVSSDPDAVRVALNHLDDDVVHQGTVYSATVPVVQYVAALLGDPRSRDLLTPSWDNGKNYPLRGRMLAWLEYVADEVSDTKMQQIREWTGDSSIETFLRYREIRAIYPTIFPSVDAYLNDPHRNVREAAIAAAVRLLGSPELASHREALAPLVRNVLAVSSEERHRRLAIEALEAWGEDVGSLRGTVKPLAAYCYSWDDAAYWGTGSIDERPF
jgi:hypothetical protein